MNSILGVGSPCAVPASKLVAYLLKLRHPRGKEMAVLEHDPTPKFASLSNGLFGPLALPLSE